MALLYYCQVWYITTLDDDEYDEQVDPTDHGQGILTRYKDIYHDFVFSGAVHNFHFSWQNSQAIQQQVFELDFYSHCYHAERVVHGHKHN